MQNICDIRCQKYSYLTHIDTLGMNFLKIKIIDQHMNAKCHMHFMKKYFYFGVPSSFDYVCTYRGLSRFSKHIGHV